MPPSSSRILSRIGHVLAAGCLAGAIFLVASPGHAQAPPMTSAIPERSDSWDKATKITALSALGFELIMPRVFYADPEVTAGWKGRWHLSVLAPIMTLATVTLANEQFLKDSFEGRRPGCDDTNQGMPGCTSFGMMSSPTFLAFGALGQGAAIFVVDTTKWSDGHFSAGALFGHVGVPLVLSVMTAVGRTSGNWESGGQVWSSAGIGLGTGLVMGLLYSTLQRPECGYSGNLICW